MKNPEFSDLFQDLTGHPPFPWQVALYERFTSGDAGDLPKVVSIPTGLGKTMVIAVWLIALLKHPGRLPRRLVYVVNRRTVVDQTTAEVEKLRKNFGQLTKALGSEFERLGISTLRGQYADNREWSADPSQPAVICGTVDMIGSRLLFGGYRIGFKSRPLHAGFLGQDALLVHDEAHLEPAFQCLIETIQEEQATREQTVDLPWPKLQVMALSATARRDDAGEEGNEPTVENGQLFRLTDDERSVPANAPKKPSEPIEHLWKRMAATKQLELHPCQNENKELVNQLVDLAWAHHEDDVAVLLFARSVEDVAKTAEALEKRLRKAKLPINVETLTGTMRGLERDQLAESNPIFARFQPEGARSSTVEPAQGACFLVCTSAGEVGVNLSADHLVCDLSTFDSMAQRFGRVNRFGDSVDTRIDVVHPETWDEKHDLTPARKLTLALLQKLAGDASPASLENLTADERAAAFAPLPEMLLATGILLDAWALTTIREPLPGRPPLAAYLHGVAEWEPPRTNVAWREEVQRVTPAMLSEPINDFAKELLETFPLKPHELLNDRTDRVFKELQTLAKKHPSAQVWVIDEQRELQVKRLNQVADPAAKGNQRKRLEAALAEATVLLPPEVGGLTSQGTLSSKADVAPGLKNRYDISCGWREADGTWKHWCDAEGRPQRYRRWDEEEPPASIDLERMALKLTIDTDPTADEFAAPEFVDDESPEVTSQRRLWRWFTHARAVAEDPTLTAQVPITWQHHTQDVVDRAEAIVRRLDLPTELQQAVVLAARLHDLGKRRELWQHSIGNPVPTDFYAKPGKPSGKPRWQPNRVSPYRHEFGSLLDALSPAREHLADFQDALAKLHGLPDELQDIVLHLIAAHHGCARPHFPPETTVDPYYDQVTSEDVAVEVARRFARLQRQYGRWGLTYLESLLRAADWAASAEPSPVDGSTADTEEVLQ